LQLVVREIERQPTAPDQAVDDRDAIVAALRRLPDFERTALVLRYVDDLSVREVAGLLGRTVDATDALIRRAKERFRGVYPEAFDD
jgi:RNA polymerase sigma-70 factor (ECF subfamily)